MSGNSFSSATYRRRCDARLARYVQRYTAVQRPRPCGHPERVLAWWARLERLYLPPEHWGKERWN